MKIKYFSYIAEQSFKTSPNGERLFYSGFSLTPYVIPNQDTEKRLFRKQLWFLRIGLGGLILSQPFLFLNIPAIINAPLWFLSYLVVIMLLFGLANWLIFRNELPNLKRATKRLFLFAFYRDTARRHSVVGLVLSLLLCMAFIWAGFWTIRNDFNPIIGWICIVLFGLCAFAWGYTLFLKLTMPKDKEIGDNKSEA